MPYRVFIGSPGVFHCKARTKQDAINALFDHINAMHCAALAAGDTAAADVHSRHKAQLMADADRIKRERFKPMPSGLHGPYYRAPFGSICSA